MINSEYRHLRGTHRPFRGTRAAYEKWFYDTYKADIDRIRAQRRTYRQSRQRLRREQMEMEDE